MHQVAHIDCSAPSGKQHEPLTGVWENWLILVPPYVVNISSYNGLLFVGTPWWHHDMETFFCITDQSTNDWWIPLTKGQ